MEFHIPDHPVMTWKQFFVHMAIVVLGIIVALSLEQTLEYLHHEHQRKTLQAQLQQEMRHNDPDLRDLYNKLSVRREWAAERSRTIETALAEHHSISSLQLPPYVAPPNRSFLPNGSVWQQGHETGTVALLPDQESEAYSMLYRFRDDLIESYDQRQAAEEDFSVLTLPFADAKGDPDISRMSPEALQDYVKALARVAETARKEQYYITEMLMAQEFVESGVANESAIGEAIRSPKNPYLSLPAELPPAPPISTFTH